MRRALFAAVPLAVGLTLVAVQPAEAAVSRAENIGSSGYIVVTDIRSKKPVIRTVTLWPGQVTPSGFDADWIWPQSGSDLQWRTPGGKWKCTRSGGTKVKKPYIEARSVASC